MFDPITSGFVDWLCGKAADSVLLHIAKSDALRKDLERTIKDWSKSLPKDQYVDPNAMFPLSDINVQNSERPHYLKLQQMLIDKDLPTEQVLFNAFMENWHYVKNNVSDPQPFFRIPEKDAAENLKKLAKMTLRTCQNNEQIFHSFVCDTLTELKKPFSGTPTALHNLPFPSIGNLFKGREDVLKSLKSILEVKTPTAITQSIEGLGGIGKTRLAVEFAWWVWNNNICPAVFFIFAESSERLNASLASLANPDCLNLPGQKQDEQITSVKNWLNDNPGFLIILDNADTRDAAKAVEKLLPSLANGCTIITSRYTRWSSAVNPQTLGLLNLNDAVAFLLDKTNRRIQTADDQTLAAQLAKDLDYLPLALEHAGAFINTQKITFAEYLNQWQIEKSQFLEWFDETQTKYPLSLAAAFQRSLKELSPHAKAILSISANLAPEPIPIEMFEIEDNQPLLTEAVNIITKKQTIKTSNFNLSSALADLAAYSLITKEKTSFTIHRIVQQAVLFSLSKSLYKKWLTISLNIVDNFTPTDSNDVRTWSVIDSLFPHIKTIVQKADQSEITEPTSRLMSVLGSYLYSKGLYKEAEPFKRRALKIDETSFGPDHPDVASDLNNLASLLQDTNRLSEAEPLMRRALKIIEKSLGKNHPNVATALNNLAELLRETGRFEGAEPLYHRALKIDQTSFGPYHPNVAIDLNNLALLLKDTNRLSEAEPLMRRALEIDQTSLGPDHPNVARDLNNLAQLLQATNRFSEAEPLYERVVKIFEISLGKNHPNVATALNNLAQLLQATNRLSEAEPFMRRALKIDETSFGLDHPDVAIDLNNLAELLQDTNRLSEAEPLYKRALKICENSFGPDHPSTKLVRKNYELFKKLYNH
jgi:tetratricopeptide (TPR) repeat protein